MPTIIAVSSLVHAASNVRIDSVTLVKIDEKDRKER
jgi:hypothetical protein